MSTVFHIDASHSSLTFAASAGATGVVRGSFARFRGAIEIDDDVARSAIEVEIDAASLRTGDDHRDLRLRSDRALDADGFPFITFVSRHVEPLPLGRLRVTGTLTLQGTAREVTVEVVSRGATDDAQGRQRVAFSAHGSIERGGATPGDRVDVTCELEALRASPRALRGELAIAAWLAPR